MSRFKQKGSKELPPISTSSLPDVIFMLLFFFMAVAVMKSVDLGGGCNNQTADTLTRFENASMMANIRVGTRARDPRPLCSAGSS